jgi:hypothetical protein
MQIHGHFVVKHCALSQWSNDVYGRCLIVRAGHPAWLESDYVLPTGRPPSTSFGCVARSSKLRWLRASDTMLVLDLHERFDEVELKNWFEEWQDDGLLFLTSVGSR